MAGRRKDRDTASVGHWLALCNSCQWVGVVADAYVDDMGRLRCALCGSFRMDVHEVSRDWSSDGKE